MVFSGIFALIKGWLDEKTKQKISVLGSNCYSKIAEYIDDDQIPWFFGGKNMTNGIEQTGPWVEYELVESPNQEQVGIKRIDDPNGILFTPQS